MMTTVLVTFLAVFVLHDNQSLAYGKKFEKGLLYGYLLAKVNSLSHHHQQQQPPM